MEDLQRFDIKILAEKGRDIPPIEFVPVLQKWIQRHDIEGVLIDVANYSHVHNGAGVILIGHESNVSIDYAEGGMGLLQRRRQPLEGAFVERCEAVLKSALAACELLENDEAFAGRLKFSRSHMLFIANDRLAAPNHAPAQDALRRDVEAAFSKVLGGAVRIEARAPDAAARPIFEIKAA